MGATQSVCVDLVAQLLRCFARSGCEIFASRGVENSAGRADDQPRACGGLSVLHGLSNIATLRPHAWHQEWHVAHDLADFRQFARISSAYDQQAIAAGVPAIRREVRNDVEQTPAADLHILQILGTRIRGAAENDDAFVLVLEKWLEGIPAQIGIYGN